MDRTERYVRTPLPDSVDVPVGLSIVLWLAVLFSPFVAFSVNDANWIPALVTPGVSLLLLAHLNAKAAKSFSNLPQAHRDEYRNGKLFQALPSAASRAVYEFELGRKGAIAHLSKEGVCFSPAATLAFDFSRMRMAARKLRSARQDEPVYAVQWREIQQWAVHKNSDGPDYYSLILTDGGSIGVHRPSKVEEEVELLDAVRSLGQTAVSLHCDLPY
jgi:hypothetical protein